MQKLPIGVIACSLIVTLSPAMVPFGRETYRHLDDPSVSSVGTAHVDAGVARTTGALTPWQPEILTAFVMPFRPRRATAFVMPFRPRRSTAFVMPFRPRRTLQG